MNKDDVIRLAEQAGMTRDGEFWFSNGKSDMDVEQKHLEAFAKLVAERERDEISKLLARLADSYELSDKQGSASDIKKLIDYIKGQE